MARTYKRPMFSQRHYEETARHLGYALRVADQLSAPADTLAGIEATTQVIATMFDEDNPTFDIDRFLTAVNKTRTEGLEQ